MKKTHKILKLIKYFKDDAADKNSHQLNPEGNILYFNQI